MTREVGVELVGEHRQRTPAASAGAAVLPEKWMFLTPPGPATSMSGPTGLS